MGTMQPIEKQLIIHDLLITYYVSGRENAERTFVVLHGWGSQSSHLFSAMSPLVQTSQVIFIDLPGFGKSQTPHTPWGLYEYVDCVFECLNTLEIKKTTMIGHSFGGSIALLLAVKQPRIVESLILIDSAGVRETSKRKHIIHILASAVRPIFRFGCMQSMRQWIYKKIGSEDYLTLPNMRETYKKVISMDITPLLSSVKQKTFLIWGEEDTMTPIADATILKQNIPNARLTVISHAGHYCFLDQPEEFKKILRSYANH
jgi:pimeloyl-ACP methyl ester carboxylesterase